MPYVVRTEIFYSFSVRYKSLVISTKMNCSTSEVRVWCGIFMVTTKSMAQYLSEPDSIVQRLSQEKFYLGWKIEPTWHIDGFR